MARTPRRSCAPCATSSRPADPLVATPAKRARSRDPHPRHPPAQARHRPAGARGIVRRMSESPAAALVRQLRQAVRDERVLAAIEELPRERFVPDDHRANAYDNVALPIGSGQTISQPLVVARMLEMLRPQPEDRVLDVGTGSGYHAALLARLAGHVWTIERYSGLAARARETLRQLGIENVDVIVGDGCEGLPERAPFD